MKKIYLNFIIISFLFYSCENDQDITPAIDSNIEFNGKNAVIKSEDLSNIRLKDISGSLSVDEATPQGQVRVESSGELDKWLEVKKEGGELRIEGKNDFPASMDLNFFIHPNDIRKIVVEGKNKVEIISTPVLEYLEIVTEGESQLVIHNLKVKNLLSKREGKSQMFLSSMVKETEFDRENLSFSINSVDILDENNILYTEDGVDYLIYAPEIDIRDDIVFVKGNNSNDPINVFFITHTHELRNEGESFLDALELPTSSVISKNEGKSESKVWAVHHLNVKGEGESIMYYAGNPVVEMKMEGDSRLIKLP